MIKETRNITRVIENALWACSAGRCEFMGCNKLLYKSPVTEELVNISEKAHIYSFSENGPRGWGPFKNEGNINDISNLMLVCSDCHKTIDQSQSSNRYPAELLIKWKKLHELRIYTVTGISHSMKSQVIFYGANIGEQYSPLDSIRAIEAMFPEWYPTENHISLSMKCIHVDVDESYWINESENLVKMFERRVRPLIEENQQCHFSLFSMAPQPLLILLGTLFTDKVPVEVYQLHREPQTWEWQNHSGDFKFEVNTPDNFNNAPVLVISLSDKINCERVTSLFKDNVNIWELTIQNPNNDFLKSREQLGMFREKARELMVLIKGKHGQSTPLRIFPAMPIACAVEFGRVRMPKADMPWIIYDQNNKAGKFIQTISIQ
jgi:hypothetical protein